MSSRSSRDCSPAFSLGPLLTGVLLFAALLIFVAFRRRLASEEASLLLAALDNDVSSDLRVRLLQGWSALAGTMERAARSLSLLSGLAALSLIAGCVARRRGTVAGLCVLLGAAALPATWTESTQIGGAGPVMLVSAVLTAVLMALRFPGPLAASLGAATVLAFSWWQAPSAEPMTQATWQRSFIPGSGFLREESLIALLIGGAALLLLLVPFVFARGPQRFLLLPFAGLLVATLLLPLGPAWLLAGAILPALALLIAYASETRPRVAPLALSLLAAASLGTVWRTLDDERQANRDPRPALEWVAARPIEGAWVGYLGDDADLAAYYAASGHRSGMQTFKVRERESWEKTASDLGVFKVPYLILIGGFDDLEEVLAPRFERLVVTKGGPQGNPDLVSVWRFRSE